MPTPHDGPFSVRGCLLAAAALLGMAAAAAAQPVVIRPPASGQAPSPAYQNVQGAIDFLRQMGHIREAVELEVKLERGEIRYDISQKTNGDTSAGIPKYITGMRATALGERARGAEQRLAEARSHLAASDREVGRLTRSLETSRSQMARQTSAEGRALVG